MSAHRDIDAAQKKASIDVVRLRRRSEAPIVVAATRAALTAFLREATASIQRDLRRLDEIEAWANGGPVPPDALRYVESEDALDTADCNCDRVSCSHCTGRHVQRSEFWGMFDLQLNVQVLLNWAAGAERHTSDKQGAAELISNLFSEVVESSNSGDDDAIFEAILDALEVAGKPPVKTKNEAA